MDARWYLYYCVVVHLYPLEVDHCKGLHYVGALLLGEGVRYAVAPPAVVCVVGSRLVVVEREQFAGFGIHFTA